MKVAVESIVIPDKSVEIDQKKIEDMQDSMKEMGMSHPIIVRRENNSKFVLISGEKRLLAAKGLGWSEIEADVRVMTDLNGKILRLHENLRRFNLEWPEQVVLVDELHKLRQEEHGVAGTGRPVAAEVVKKWSMRDTASELKVGVGHLSEDILLARALRIDPKLANVKDKKTAIKLARITVARRREEDESLAPEYQFIKTEHNTTYLGDSAEILSRLEDNSIDVCITDPPWIKFFDPKLRIDERTLPVFKEIFRVLKHDSLMYVFTGLDDFIYYTGYTKPLKDGETQRVFGQLEGIGFTCSMTPIIWHKTKSLSRRGVKPWEYDRDFEYVIVAAKGNPILTDGTRCKGVKPFDVVPSPSLIHPNEKPIKLIEELIGESSYKNQVVLDPFAGSGVVGAAAKRTGRKYVLIERDPKFHAAIMRRLKEK